MAYYGQSSRVSTAQQDRDRQSHLEQGGTSLEVARWGDVYLATWPGGELSGTAREICDRLATLYPNFKVPYDGFGYEAKVIAQDGTSDHMQICARRRRVFVATRYEDGPAEGFYLAPPAGSVRAAGLAGFGD